MHESRIRLTFHDLNQLRYSLNLAILNDAEQNETIK